MSIVVDPKGIKIDPEKLLDILEKTGGHCPCVVKSARSEDTLCQCKEYREIGHCHCGFYKEVSRGSLLDASSLSSGTLDGNSLVVG